MQTRVVVAPEGEPVTLEEAKRHANVAVDFEDDDAYISGLIRAARGYLENTLGRAFVAQTLETTWDEFPPYWGAFRLPRAPVQSIVEASYVDSTPEIQVIDPAIYRPQVGTPGVVSLASSSFWPTGYSPAVRYVAGYGDPVDVPEEAKLAIKMLVASWYDRREVVAQGVVTPLPFAVDALCDSLRWGGMAG